MQLLILRVVFLFVAIGVATLLVTSPGFVELDNPPLLPVVIFLGTLFLAGATVAADIFLSKKPIDVISAVYFGLLVGVFLTYVVMLVLTPLLPPPSDASHYARGMRTAIPMLLGMVLCYVCISLLIQTKDDFRFIIPYVEFSKEVKGLKPLVLDTSVVIDGRIADVIETEILDSQLIMPRFVIAELQGIADSSDKLRRSRGRRGLDILNRLRSNDRVDLQIYDRELPEMDGQPVDMKLVLLAKHIEGK